MARILGISAYFHDSAAALTVEGKTVAAAQEERFTRKKHDASFPRHAVDYCLRESGLKPSDLDYVAFYEKPLQHFDRLLESYLARAPRGWRSFRRAMPLWLREKLHLRRTLRRELVGADRAKLVFTEHHESHAASAFFPSPFERAAILTCDGVGEWATTTWGVGAGNQLDLRQQINFPHSLGLLYSAFTYYCGFKVNSGEYKLMGLAPYGEPRYVQTILDELVSLHEDGSLWVNERCFDYVAGLTMTNDAFDELFGGPPRQPEAQLEQRHLDLAASIQRVTEGALLRMARMIHRETGERNLVMAGGVALNCVANGRLRREGPFENIWVQPAAGDAGGALGAALFVHHQLLERPRTVQAGDSQQGSLFGPQFSENTIQQSVSSAGVPSHPHADEAALLNAVADLLAAGKVVGWFYGRMEFGPRALGARSILADARRAETQSTLNLKIKFRESFRPFAPMVLKERAAEIFEMRPDDENPYMMFTAPVREEWRTKLSDADAATLLRDPDLRKRVNVVRSQFPAITHVDYSARLQTVDAERHPRLHRLLKAFEAKTNCPMLVNTSFNIRGEPIVCTPEDALRCFLATDMDVLVLENHVLLKSEMPAELVAAEKKRHLSSFEPD